MDLSLVSIPRLTLETPIVYEHKMVVSKETGKHPIFIGPVLIHTDRKYTTYYNIVYATSHTWLSASSLDACHWMHEWMNVIPATSKKPDL